MSAARLAGAAALLALLGAAALARAQAAIVAIEPSRAARPGPAVDVARAALAATAGAPSGRLELAAATRPAAGLSVVRFRETHRGLPVLGKGATVVLDADGRAVVATRDLARDLPVDVSPRLDAGVATEIAARTAGVARDRTTARLALLPMPDGARLVWVVTGSGRSAVPRAPLVVVDADDGAVLIAVDSLRWLDRAYAYAGNPVTTPDVSEFVLPLPDGATTLTSPALRALSCVDHHDLRATPLGTIHVCVAEQRDVADAAGDFLYPTPSPTDPDDPFAEASAFHHASRALARFVELGVPSAALGQLDVIVNVRWPTGWLAGDTSKRTDPTAPLEPLPGSFYLAASPAFVGSDGTLGGVWLGQGPVSDYAADADDVYHEVGHAAVDATVKLVPWLHADEQGLSQAPGALNEAIADYFSCALTGDPHVGESVAPNLRPGLAAYRSLDGGARCPEDVSGEAHFDSLVVSGPLWVVRAELPAAEQGAFDQAVMSALIALPGGDVALEDFAELAVTTVAASSLGQSVGDRLRAEFTTRGVLPRCRRVLEFTGTPMNSKDELRSGSTWLAPGRFDTPWSNMGQPPPLDYTPGIVEVHASVPVGATALAISFSATEPGASPRVLVRWGASPIAFTWTSPPDVDAVLVPDATSPVRASVAVPAGAADVVVMVANAGDHAYHYRALDLHFTLGAADSDAGDGDSGTAAAAPGDLAASGGCACAASRSASPRLPGLSALLLFATLASRSGRRSRRRRRRFRAGPTNPPGSPCRARGAPLP